VLHRPARIAGVGRLTQRVLGLVNPALRELGETWYQRDRPFVLDAGRFQRTFGPRLATPLPEAVAETLDWFRRQGR
jgi:nucleoside-diphosphate-sugar epimerase